MSWRLIAITAFASALVACSPSGPHDAGASPTTSLTTADRVDTGATAPPQSSSAPSRGEPATGFYDAGGSADTAYAQLLHEGRDADAALIKLIADQPTAVWLGDWQSSQSALGTVRGIVRGAEEENRIPVFVIYAIPGRDCGLYSAGGLPESDYLEFVGAIAEGVEGAAVDVWIILEPDALAQLGDCEGQGDRAGLLAGAARILDDAGASVFLDAGNSNWNSVDETVRRLGVVGTSHLTGFATNTSNYNATGSEAAWGEQIAALTGLSFVVDTSRNGNGSDGQWCNPRGRALGEPPRLSSDGPMVATLWVKAPGESDGTCNGGPAAGQWWPEIAFEMARNATS
jgi:endoglucanase